MTTVKLTTSPVQVTIGGGRTARIPLNQGTVDKVVALRTTTVKQGGNNVDIASDVARIINVGQRGQQGAPGVTEGATFNATAGMTIHGDRVVRVEGGLLYEVATSVPAHATQVVGISTQAGLTGAQVQVRTGGVMTDAGWNWAPGVVFSGPDGVLTQSPSATGWLLRVGRVLTPTSLLVDVDEAYLR